MREFRTQNIYAQVHDTSDALAQAAASFVADRIRAAVHERGEARVIFATGNSQLAFLTALTALDDVPWERVTGFHLDEYVELSETHPASFRRYLQERLFSLKPFRAVYLLNGEADDLRFECRRYANLLSAAPIDLACIGIGENAHLAFNDPPADLKTREWVHVVTLDTACRQQQVGEGHFATVADVPERALSLSVPAILKSAVVSCVVPDARKAAAVRCTLEEPVSADCPASALQTHRRCHLFLDTDSASQLS